MEFQIAKLIPRFYLIVLVKNNLIQTFILNILHFLVMLQTIILDEQNTDELNRI